MRPVWAARVLSCVAIGACQIDMREFDALESTGSDGSGGGLLVQPSSIASRALAPPRLLVDRPRVEFGEVVVGGTGVLDLAIGNGGDEPLPALVSSVAGGVQSDFQVSANGCSVPLSAVESCSISISFSPGATGPQGATLNLDAGSAGSLGVELSGTGLAAGNLLVVAADGRNDCGSVALGNETERPFRISNTSNEGWAPSLSPSTATISASSLRRAPSVPLARRVLPAAPPVTSVCASRRCSAGSATRRSRYPPGSAAPRSA
jgi:hypothetical protein